MKRNSGTDTRPSPGRVGVSGQAPLGRNAMTVFLGEDVENQASLQTNATGPRRRKWSTNDNRLLMECYFKSRPDERGYRQRMHRIWRQSGGDVAISEQRLADQVRTIKSKGWFSRAELEDIKRHALPSSETNNREHPPPQAPAAPPQELHDPSTSTTREPDEPPSPGPTSPTQQPQDERLQSILQRMTQERRSRLQALRHVPKKKLMKEVNAVDRLLSTVETATITQTMDLVYACAQTVTERLTEGKKTAQNGPSEPPWRRRLSDQIAQLRSDISKLEAMQKGDLRSKKQTQALKTKYKITKDYRTTIETLKQRLTALAARLKRYDARAQQWRQNQLFRNNQRMLYEELDGKTRNQQAIPDAEESKHFWSDLWDKNVKHNNKAKWLEEQEKETASVVRQEDIQISVGSVRQQLRRMPNWKSPGPDEIHGFWLKNLRSLHPRIAQQLQDCLQRGQVPQWMVEGRTTLIMKDPDKGSVVTNYRPIACLPVVYKLLTGIMAEAIYQHLHNNSLLPVEQKGCRRNCRGTKDQLLIDKMVLRNSKRRKTNLNMAWIDYKKAYDMVPHSWVLETLNMVGIAENIRSLVENNMKLWRTQLTAGGATLGTVHIRRGIFQGDSLSPLLFIIAMMPLTKILRRHTAGYSLGKNEAKLNHLLFMDDLKLYGKTDKEIESLVQTVRVFSEDISMEFGIEKCASISIKRGKVHHHEGIRLPDGRTIQSMEEGQHYKYLGVLEADDIKHSDMKEVIRKEYLRRVKKVLKSKLNGGNTIKAINTWAVSLVRYAAGIVNWTKAELDEIDRKTRKIMTIYRALHPRADVDRLYLPRSEGGRGMMSMVDCVQAEEISLNEYIHESEEILLKATARANTLGEWNGETKQDYKKRMRKERKANWMAKPLHGQFPRQTEPVRGGKSWSWLERGELKKETEGLLMAAQDQALRTNNLKVHIEKQEGSPLCRMCHDKNESVGHLVSECSKLAQREYKGRHDRVATAVHWGLCQKYGIPSTEQWYKHRAEAVVETQQVKLLWDFTIQTDHVIEHRRPDIVVLEKQAKRALIIDIAVPGDCRVDEKEKEKMERYEELAREIRRLWEVHTKVIPVVVGALGVVPDGLEQHLKTLDIEAKPDLLQKIALLGTARILRRVLDLEDESQG